MTVQRRLRILASVGAGGRNRSQDVRTIQHAVNVAGYGPLRVDGLCGRKTVAAIGRFQSAFMRVPDRRIDPWGRTLKQLAVRQAPVDGGLQVAIPHRSTEWDGRSDRWPQTKKLASLSPDFRPLVERVLADLRAKSFRPKIFYAWRSVEVQRELVRKGRSKVRFSFHNAQRPDGTPRALAVDIVDRRWGWGAAADQRGFWDALGEIAQQLDLVWGGTWTFKDLAHVQLLPNRELRRVRRESGLAWREDV